MTRRPQHRPGTPPPTLHGTWGPQVDRRSLGDASTTRERFAPEQVVHAVGCYRVDCDGECASLGGVA